MIQSGMTEKKAALVLLGLWACVVVVRASGPLTMLGETRQSCSALYGGWLSCGPCYCCYEAAKTPCWCQGLNVADVPSDLPANITHLTLYRTGIVHLMGQRVPGNRFNSSQFCRYPQIEILSFRENDLLRSVDQGAFDMSCENDAISALVNVLITHSAALTTIKDGAFGTFPHLKVLELTNCGIEEVPDWSFFTTNLQSSHRRGFLDKLNLANNKIKHVRRDAFRFGASIEVYELSLEDNDIESLEAGAFTDAEIRYVKMRRNPKLNYIHPDTFEDVKMLDNLDISESQIKELPIKGLHVVENLTLQDVPTLKVFPSVFNFSSIKEAHLTYAYHCCAFAFPSLQDTALYEKLLREVQENCDKFGGQDGHVLGDSAPTTPMTGFVESIFVPTTRRKRHSRLVPQWMALMLKEEQHQHQQRSRRGHGRSVNPHGGWSGGNFSLHDSRSDDIWIATPLDPKKNYTARFDCGLGQVVEVVKKVKCTPQPDAMNPCEDVMGHQWLRIVVWFVVTTALFGNLLVLLVTLLSRFKLTVVKFLMCNLSFADFCLGFYLLILAAYDIHTIGAYFSSAIPWQYEGGCGVAGFLAVFSICLSIFTLTVITMERWYAISHAIHLTKRLHMRQACYIMIGGWLYALIMAVLPLVGISSYSRTSTCLPMDTQNMLGKAYVFLLLITNAGAFVVICICYLDMFRKVRGNNNAAGSGDAIIAKRMAILVFTDFACLFPMAFFGLTAAAGKPLITVTDSKILMVFFFPLNACANPFLYVIFTRQFKKDLFGLLSLRCGFFEKRAARYRATFSTPISSSHSRNSLPNPHLIHRSSAASALTALLSLNHSSSSKGHPSGGPKWTAKGSPQNVKRSSYQMTSTPDKEEQIISKAQTNPFGADKTEPRKLSVVPETSHAPEDIDDVVAELNFEARIAEQPKSRTVRSASEYSHYTPLYKGNSFDSQTTFQKGGSFDFERFDRRKESQSTSLSSNTETSILSDSSGVPDTPSQPPIAENEYEETFDKDQGGSDYPHETSHTCTQPVLTPQHKNIDLNIKNVIPMTEHYREDIPCVKGKRPSPERDSGLPSPETDSHEEKLYVRD